MKTHYVLIDYENVQVQSLEKLQEEHFQVKVFLGRNNTRLATEFVLAMKQLGPRGDYIQLEKAGKNALDFHIAYYLGRLAVADPMAVYHIISKDTGFDALVDHLRDSKIACERVAHIDDMACLKPAAVKAPATKPPAAKAPAASKPTATKMKADQLTEKMLVNLEKLGTGKPKTEKTLKGKIQNWCGKAYSEKEVEAVFNRLVKKGVVLVDGTKVSYKSGSSA